MEYLKKFCCCPKGNPKTNQQKSDGKIKKEDTSELSIIVKEQEKNLDLTVEEKARITMGHKVIWILQMQKGLCPDLVKHTASYLNLMRAAFANHEPVWDEADTKALDVIFKGEARTWVAAGMPTRFYKEGIFEDINLTNRTNLTLKELHKINKAARKFPAEKKRIMVIDVELHADAEEVLLENESEQENLWGINIYPYRNRADSNFVEFYSMINLRPSQGNLSRHIENPALQKQILKIVNDLIK